MARSMVKSRSHHDIAHLQPLINVPTKHQLPTPYGFWDIARTKDFIGQCHYGKVKGQIKVRPWCCIPTPPNQCPYHVSTSYTLRFLRYSPDKISKLKTTVARSKVKSRSDHDDAHLHILTNVPTKYQLPTPYGFWDTARTNFFPRPTRPSGHHPNAGTMFANFGIIARWLIADQWPVKFKYNRCLLNSFLHSLLVTMKHQPY